MIDPVMFRAYIRMTCVQYEHLLQVGPKLISAPTRDEVVTPSQKLMVTLRYSVDVMKLLLNNNQRFFNYQAYIINKHLY